MLSLLIGVWVEAQPDWADLARQDIEFASQTLMENHPGPVNNLDPGFADRLGAARQSALALAARAETDLGYRAAVWHFGARFNDNHLGIGSFISSPGYRWPGQILVRTIDGEMRVASQHFEDGPPAGSRLVSCNGIDPDTLLRDREFRFGGVEARETDWILHAPRLFLDRANPFLEPLTSCRYIRPGETDAETYPLSWRDVDIRDWMAHVDASRGGPQIYATGLQEFAPDQFWISLPDFNPDAGTQAELDAVIAEIQARRDELRAAERIVFDMRGNAGGSSQWGWQIASILWGEAYLAARSPGVPAIDWRVSAGNLVHVEGIAQRAFDRGNPDYAAHFSRVADAMRDALAHGEDLVRMQGNERVHPIPDGPYQARPSGADETAGNPVQAEVLFLNVGGDCSSACLDFADLVLSTETARMVGWMTGADSLYIEVRQVDLPSGQGRLGFPVKVYRGRARGDMEAYIPDVTYSGRDFSTTALQAWVLQLPQAGDARR